MTCVECGRGLGPASGTGRPRRYCSRSCQSRAYRRRRDGGRLAASAAQPSVGRGGEPGSGSGDARADLVHAAVGLADAHGLDTVTLRTVAQHAGIALPEARRAFGSRDRLVATLVQQLLARRRGTVPASDGPVETLARLAAEEWATYREHPWLVSVLASSRPPLVPAVLDAARASTEAFGQLGLDPPTALARYIALSGYVQGMAVMLLAEHEQAGRSGTAYRAWWAEEARRLDRTGARWHHPWLDAASGGSLPDTFDADVDAWFRDGLARVLAGLTPSDDEP
ncbi:TetR/AcrR family transcriptional regulator [Promicromonospora iranensis]|uniref:AcrR family transcriptional regulator n=1 Tax=Promicromonospora iranensis TaxID=1105144 RepID=A0ABU2CWG8_9MICO|nr:TetR/AcrR family transcriptional regulator [Promicromonospora iranensis]MDR7385700.1 AcrR family transcriptional regulator [Promicromonospora iranensis]